MLSTNLREQNGAVQAPKHTHTHTYMHESDRVRHTHLTDEADGTVEPDPEV